MQHKCNRKKNSCAAVRKKEKVLQSYFIISGVFKKSQQNCNHSLPLLTLNSGFDDAAKLLLHMCNALLAYHKQYYKCVQSRLGAVDGSLPIVFPMVHHFIMEQQQCLMEEVVTCKQLCFNTLYVINTGNQNCYRKKPFFSFSPLGWCSMHTVMGCVLKVIVSFQMGLL